MKLNEVIAKYGNQEVDESKIKEVLGVKESKVWKPNEDEQYWFIYGHGNIDSVYWRGDIDENHYRYGNVYKTREEAEFARDKQIFLTKFERYLRENEDEPVKWNNNVANHFIKYDYLEKEIVCDCRRAFQQQGTIYTTNQVALEQFIKDNESDIKKYMFGVE